MGRVSATKIGMKQYLKLKILSTVLAIITNAFPLKSYFSNIISAKMIL